MEDNSNLSFKRRLEVNDFVEIIACAPSPPITYMRVEIYMIDCIYFEWIGTSW
jgi:hypothetical protein